MQLTLIRNCDVQNTIAYKIAYAVYAQTRASSLRVVEALTSMIANLSAVTGCTPIDIVNNTDIFPPHKSNDGICDQSRGFGMCMRVAKRMLNGTLPDCCSGATRFHHADQMPQWAIARGYIADIDGLLFYL